jgi:GNAT superfamily N-acetyltransferase
MTLTHRKAEPGEIDAALELLKEAAVWLRGQGVDYWQNWIAPAEKHADWIREGFDRNEFFFAYARDDLVGMYRLQDADELFWGKRDDRSAYLHSFTTKRDRHGKGTGRQILRDIESRLREQGFEYLRLDCGKKTAGLCRYYEENGFRKVGEKAIDGEELVLFEKRLTGTPRGR